MMYALIAYLYFSTSIIVLEEIGGWKLTRLSVFHFILTLFLSPIMVIPVFIYLRIKKWRKKK